MKKRYRVLLSILALILFGFVIPEPKVIPVVGATKSDWNKDSFWYEPWGTSGVHKGVDIFAAKGKNVVATTNMVILFKGQLTKGGLVVLGLGPKWRLHYFAHLDTINSDLNIFSSKGAAIGSVGDSGNAKGKQPHLHYAILSIMPMPWLMDSSTQGYKKAFFINPLKYLTTET